MEINLNDFSKPALVNIVSAARAKDILPDAALAEQLRIDLVVRCREIRKKVDRMVPVLEAEGRKITIRTPKKTLAAYNKKVDQYNRLMKSGTGMIKKIQALEETFPNMTGETSHE